MAPDSRLFISNINSFLAANKMYYSWFKPLKSIGIRNDNSRDPSLALAEFGGICHLLTGSSPWLHFEKIFHSEVHVTLDQSIFRTFLEKSKISFIFFKKLQKIL